MDKRINKDIAIIGMACKFPGAQNYREFWNNLKEGKSSISEIPQERWDWREYESYTEDNREIFVSKWGGFIDHVDAFDADFFNMSNIEVEAMDPQQRLMLELTWSCFEDACICPSAVSGKKVGVYVSAFNFDFKELLENGNVVEAHHSTGTSAAVISNRISYYYDLKGPSMEIDTACSGSLTAIHTACQSIILDDCEMALAGGVSMILTPTRQIAFSEMGMMSPTGSCKTFDDRADGYVRGEGAGILLLKPLDKALSDGNIIHGVIKGSALNHGGKVRSLTYPNPEAQSETIIEAVQKSGVDPKSISYIEAHGTGTPKGDPIEFEGIVKAFNELCKEDKHPQYRCGIGSAKVNIGHLESAAGVAGIIKLLMSIKYKKLPGLVGFRKLNHRISIENTPFYVIDKLQDWNPEKVNGQEVPRRAGVSSFGFGGTNGHVIIEEFLNADKDTQEKGYFLICLSAKTDNTLFKKAFELRNWLDLTEENVSIGNIESTLMAGREHFENRVCFLCDNLEMLKNKLDDYINGKTDSDGIFIKEKNSSDESLSNDSRMQKITQIMNTCKDYFSSDYKSALVELAGLYISGAEIVWKNLITNLNNWVCLPTYPFEQTCFKIPYENKKRTNTENILSHDAMEDIHGKIMVPVWKKYNLTIENNDSLLKNVLIIGENTPKRDEILEEFRGYTPYVIDLDDFVHKFDFYIEEAERNSGFRHIVWLAPFCENISLVDTEVVEEQNRGVCLLFKFVRKLNELGYREKELDLTVVTFNSQAVIENEFVNPIHSGFHGLVSTIAKEFIGWNIRIADFDVKTCVDTSALFGLDIDKNGDSYAYRNGEWYKRKIANYSSPAENGKTAYRKGGVYVVIGGTGGIGEIWSRYVIENYDAQVIWIGRRAKDEKIEKKIQSCCKNGKTPYYVSADASNLESLTKAYEEIKDKFPNINGVIHSAVGLLDKSIAAMDEEMYREILSVKIDVSVYLAKVFSKENLDFIVFFSSIAAFQKLGGQSGYATGCNFKDMYAYGLAHELNCSVKTINWGYWGNVGVGEAMPDSSKKKIEFSGLEAIDPDKAMAAMEEIIKSPKTQLLYLKSTSDFEMIADDKEDITGHSNISKKEENREFSKEGEAYSFESFIEEESSQNTSFNNILNEKTVGYVKKIIGEVMRIPYSRLDINEQLERYGIDSILIVHLTDKLKKDFENISDTLFFECHTINEIVKYLISHYQNILTDMFGLKAAAEFTSGDMQREKALDQLIQEKTVAYLKKIIGEAMRVPYSRLEAGEQLERYGIDSILIVHLTDKLKKDFENISDTLFFECHTINEIAQYLINHYRTILENMFDIPKVIRDSGKTKKQQKSIHISTADKTGTNDEAIAIIGMSGRFPMANNLNEYWENLKQGKDCVTEIPDERWSLDGFYTSDVDKALRNNMSYSKWGGFIDGFADFDPLFFRIAPSEAMNMDPQERLFLEECWKTFEDGGYTKDRISKKYKGNVGVFVGVTRTGYEWYGPELLRCGEDIRPLTSFSSIANRVSFIFNLNGPSMPVDTMCSSSLSALHVACENLRWGGCDMAIAGGVNIYTHPSTYIYLCKMRMLSKTGKCYSFGSKADGFVPGEGVGAVLLKPLSKAIEDRDHIYATIIGTSMNHGGKTNGYTVPNPNAQRDLVRKAIQNAQIDARMISYIEAHGTGTSLGDPIEVNGLTQAFSMDTDDKGYCAIGAVKANIGHLEGAAGIAGVIKTVLQMNHKQFVPSIHSEELNPKIKFNDTPFYIQHNLNKWERPVININGKNKECLRIAGVSAFGAGGANAHAILEEYDEHDE